MTLVNTLTVPLTRGCFALIDTDDAWVLERKWFASVRRGGRTYAVRSTHSGGRGGTILLHRAIMGEAANGLQVDHINGDGLDNRRCNLRAVTAKTNHWNIKDAHSNSVSGVMGVYFCRRTCRWHASIKVDGRNRSLGYFDDLDEARAARLAAERGAWGIQPRRADLHASVAHITVAPRTGLYRNNQSGCPGVSFHASRQVWTARLERGGKIVFGGRFKTKEEAIAARRAAEARFEFGSPVNGS